MALIAASGFAAHQAGAWLCDDREDSTKEALSASGQRRHNATSFALFRGALKVRDPKARVEPARSWRGLGRQPLQSLKGMRFGLVILRLMNRRRSCVSGRGGRKLFGGSLLRDLFRAITGMAL
jgi:hypothetical protein